MKYFFVFFILVFLFVHQTSYAQKVTRVSILDFGAKPNDNINDQDAFTKASKFINEKKRDICLVIPTGLYIVGTQKKQLSTKYIIPENILTIKDCTNITIQGSKQTKILFAQNLKFGGFNSDGSLNNDPNYYNNHPKDNYDANLKNYYSIGNFIEVINSNSVNIQNLSVDGNILNAIWGGNWGWAYDEKSLKRNIELTHSGLYILNSKNVKLDYLTIENFGLDGLYLDNSKIPENANISFQNININKCGRQGISWTGGNGLSVKNTRINSIGNLKNNKSELTLITSPTLGIDIEPPTGATCEYAFFDNIFIENAGEGAIGISGNNKNISFKNSTFIASKYSYASVAVYENINGLYFDKCKIYGGFSQVSNDGKNVVSNKVIINNSLLSDSYNNNQISSRIDDVLFLYKTKNVLIKESEIISYYKRTFNVQVLGFGEEDKMVTNSELPTFVKNKIKSQNISIKSDINNIAYGVYFIENTINYSPKSKISIDYFKRNINKNNSFNQLQ